VLFTLFLTHVGHMSNVKSNQRRFAPILAHITGISGPLHRNTQRFPFSLHISQRVCMALSGHTVSPCYRAKMAAHQPLFICAGLVFVKT
ncbi:MAG: hypothetical protein ACYCOX_07215, partial [Acidobacteriaceae bacterium]